ncbi:hypothetical protein MASR1M107_21040 [Ignavibacteriales bacterium]
MNSEFHTRELDRLVVKGKTLPVKVYELVGEVGMEINPDLQKAMSAYCDAMAKYRIRDFEGALELFNKALEAKPDDGPAKVYIERSKHYIESPPDENWDGVFRLTTK